MTRHMVVGHSVFAFLAAAAAANAHPKRDALEKHAAKMQKRDRDMLRPVKCSIDPQQKPYGKKYRRHNK